MTYWQFAQISAPLFLIIIFLAVMLVRTHKRVVEIRRELSPGIDPSLPHPIEIWVNNMNLYWFMLVIVMFSIILGLGVWAGFHIKS